MVPVWGNPPVSPYVQCALHTQSYQSKRPAHPADPTPKHKHTVRWAVGSHSTWWWTEVSWLLTCSILHSGLNWDPFSYLVNTVLLVNTFREVLCMWQNAALNHGMQEEKRVRKERWQLHSYTVTLTGYIQTMGRQARLAEGRNICRSRTGLRNTAFFSNRGDNDTAKAVTLNGALSY